MKKLKTIFIVVLVSLMGLAVITEDAMARGGSRSSGSRSSFRSSPSRSTPTRSYSKPKPRYVAPKKVAPKASPSKSWGSKKATTPKTSRATSKPKMSPAKQKSLETAKKNGTSFKSKDAATAAFKKNQAGKYPSKYASKPATRPSHIPSSTMVGGRSVNITYNAGIGGYGYMNTLGVIIAYDMMADAVMRNRYMASSHYIVHNPTAYAPVVYQRPVIVRTGPGFGMIIFGIFGIIAVIVVVCIVVGKFGGDSQN